MRDIGRNWKIKFPVCRGGAVAWMSGGATDRWSCGADEAVRLRAEWAPVSGCGVRVSGGFA